MGSEAQCTARLNGQGSTGKAFLESTEVVFRGDFRAAMKVAELTSIEAVDGVLRLSTATTTLELDLGPQASKWRDKILNPKSLMDKLGVKSGQRIAVAGVEDSDFLAQLGAVVPDYLTSINDGRFDIVFYSAESVDDLAGLSALKGCLAQKGAIWVVSRKGKAATVKDVEVIAAGRAAGLTDNKVTAFSSTHTALKFVSSTTSKLS